MSIILPAPGGFGEQFAVEFQAWKQEEDRRPLPDDGEPGTAVSLDDEYIAASEAEPMPPPYGSFGETSSRELNAKPDTSDPNGWQGRLRQAGVVGRDQGQFLLTYARFVVNEDARELAKRDMAARRRAEMGLPEAEFETGGGALLDASDSVTALWGGAPKFSSRMGSRDDRRAAGHR